MRRKRALPLLLCAWAVTITSALAQSSPSAGQAQAVVAPVTEPRPAVSDRAASHLRKGDALFDGGNYEAAVAEYERARELSPASELALKASYNVGVCYERLFRYDRARRAYARYLEEAGPEAPDLVAVRTRMDVLEQLLARLVIQVNVPAEVWVDDLHAGNAPGRVEIPGGRHTIVVRAAGYASAQREVTLAARATVELAFELTVVGPRKGLDSTWFWVAGGAALASLAVGGVFGVDALQRHADAERDGADPATRPRNRSPRLEAIDAAAARADALFIAGGVLSVGAVVLYFMTDWSDERPEAHEPAALVPELSPQGVQWSLRF